MNLEWNVFYYDFNAKEIKVSNVFKHGRYRKDVEDLLHKCMDINDFSDKLKSITAYYFWSKCEWETVIHPWIGDEKLRRRSMYSGSFRIIGVGLLSIYGNVGKKEKIEKLIMEEIICKNQRKF